MVSRGEFYVTMIILAGMLGAAMLFHPGKQSERIIDSSADSLVHAQRDSAYARALRYELAADSLQAVLNRKNLDLNNIHKKYENQRKKIITLPADTSLSLFIQSVEN